MGEIFQIANYIYLKGDFFFYLENPSVLVSMLNFRGVSPQKSHIENTWDFGMIIWPDFP